jgi:hypothetical protein
MITTWCVLWWLKTEQAFLAIRAEQRSQEATKGESDEP